MPRVTESLRRQWHNALMQIAEERTHDQQGRPRSPEDVATQDQDAAVLKYLLELPLGTTFDGRDVYRELFGSKL